MIRERRNLDCGFSASEITMRLECYVNVVGHAFRDLREDTRAIQSRVSSRCAPGWILSGKTRISGAPSFAASSAWANAIADLVSSLARVRRMKRARSVDATDLDCLRSLKYARVRDLLRPNSGRLVNPNFPQARATQFRRNPSLRSRGIGRGPTPDNPSVEKASFIAIFWMRTLDAACLS